MEVTDQAKARDALTVLGVVAFVEIGLLLVSQVLVHFVVDLAGGGANSVDRAFGATQVLWLIATCANLFAVWRLTRAVRESDLLYALLGGFGLIACIEVFWVFDAFIQFGARQQLQWLGYATMALNLGVTLGSCAVVGKLGRTTAFAAGIGVFAALRTLLSLGLRLSANHSVLWAYSVLTGMSVLFTFAFGLLALHARKAVSAPALAAGSAALPPPIIEASGMRLVITGVALLVVGIAVTAFSYEAASGGGRYVVATGAIATGLVQLVRGIGRLGR